MANINTTPLVDVMLVLLIIFLDHDSGDQQDGEGRSAEGGQHSDADQAGEHHGRGRQGRQHLSGTTEDARTATICSSTSRKPRCASRSRRFTSAPTRIASYEAVGRVLYTIQRGGIVKVGFLTEPDHGVRGTR